MAATAEQKADTKRYRKDIPQTGDWVFWHPSGEENSDPAPAMVLRNVNESLVANLEIHLPGGITYRDSVHHMGSIEETPKRLKAIHGGWSWEHPVRPETFKK